MSVLGRRTLKSQGQKGLDLADSENDTEDVQSRSSALVKSQDKKPLVLDWLFSFLHVTPPGLVHKRATPQIPEAPSLLSLVHAYRCIHCPAFEITHSSGYPLEKALRSATEHTNAALPS